MERRGFYLIAIFLFWSALGWFLMPYILQASHIPSYELPPMTQFFTLLISVTYGGLGILSFLLGRYKGGGIPLGDTPVCPSCGRRLKGDTVICPYCLTTVKPEEAGGTS